MPTIILIIIILLVIGIIAFIVYRVLRYMRGSIKIFLFHTKFNPGEIISGSFELKIRKRIEAQRLYAALIGEQVTEEPGRDPSRRTTTRTEIYRDEMIFELDKLYKAGITENHNFEFNTQNILNTVDCSESSSNLLGQILKEGLELAGDAGFLTKQCLEWKVEVKLIAKGIDLASSKEVSINTGDSNSGLILNPRDLF